MVDELPTVSVVAALVDDGSEAAGCSPREVGSMLRRFTDPVAPRQMAVAAHLAKCGGRGRAGVRADGRALLFRPVSFESFSVNPFFFHVSALRVSPAETRLTVYRRLSILLREQ